MGVGLIQWALDETPDDLSHAERLMLVILAESARDETGECWPGRAALMRRLHRGKSVVQHVLSGLIERGLVDVVRRSGPGRKAVYRLNPEPVDNSVNGSDLSGLVQPNGSGQSGPERVRATGPNVSGFRHQRVRTDRTLEVVPSGTVTIPSRVGANRSDVATVVSALEDRTGKTITQDHAALVVRQLLEGRDGIRDRTRYLAGAIRGDPDPARFLPTPMPPRYVRDQTGGPP